MTGACGDPVASTPPRLGRLQPGEYFIPSSTPEISWRTETDQGDWCQASAELELNRSSGETERATIAGASSVLVPWPFAPLGHLESFTLTVRTTGEDGRVSPWSEPTHAAASVPTAPWEAAFIGTGAEQPSLIRQSFTLREGIRRATLIATAAGVYQAWINGEEVDDAVLKPGWTSYQWRLDAETTDVTALVRSGGNVLGFTLAGGWYTERFGFRDAAAQFYPGPPSCSAVLTVEYDDGTAEKIVTDGRSLTAPAPTTAASLYQGEEFDARLVQGDWSTHGFDDSGWSPVVVDETPRPDPTPRVSPSIRRIERLPVREVIVTPTGKTVLDFGQNIVGWIRIRVTGAAGDTITIRHAEVLELGELGTRPLRNAKATDRYTLRGDEEETWEPQFTFHGFRYAEITGWPGELDPTRIKAVVVHSDMRRAGGFDSSSPLLNRLHENVVWGMKGNFLSVPTDCPQRDERLGWTGDVQVFTPTAAFLFDCDGFLTSWLEDLHLEQTAAGGIVPMVVPAVIPQVPGQDQPVAAWGDAATVVPSVLYERYQDVATIRRQYASMRAWVEVLRAKAGESLLWEDGLQFGDWLDPDAAPERPGDAKTDPDIVATAYFFRSTELLARAASLLGERDDEEEYRRLADRIADAYRRAYITPAGRMMSDATTAYAITIAFGLASDEWQAAAMGERLAHLVRAGAYRITTGFVGTPLICDALTNTGHADVAERLLFQTENPSWLYPVTMGATTIWERWDSMLPDGTINPGQMTSFNHYALGAVADWLHRSVAGLAPAAPGYQEQYVEPVILNGLDHARAWHETPFGRAEAGWRRDTGLVVVDVLVPPNTRAEIVMPSGSRYRVGSGRHQWTEPAPKTEPSRRTLSLDSALTDIIDDVEAYDTVLRAIASHDPDLADAFRKHTKWTPGRQLREPLNKAPLPILREIETALAALEDPEPGERDRSAA